MIFSLVVYLLLVLSCGQINAQVTLINPKTDQSLLNRFQDAKLGLFVHWMVCHTPETGDSWGIGHTKSKAASDSITMLWNPVNFDPVEIVDAAENSGCKYVVVISKHHDGFCLWNSKYSVFDIERIGYKRDILKELSDECHKRGLLYGIYYSIADIDYCGWNQMPIAGVSPKNPKYGKDDFVKFVHNQTEELIQNYNPDILWFDGFWLDPIWGAKEGRDLYNFIQSIKPSILSTRLAVTKDGTGNETFINDGSSGDFFSMEAKTVEGPNFPWEACSSITYPVYAYEPEAKMISPKDLCMMFSKTLCGNGNLLMNIGPKPDGSMPKEHVARLNELGKWIYQNKDAVYETKGGPYIQGDWGGSTYNDNIIYLHLRQNSSELELQVPQGYKIKKVYDLVTKENIKFNQSKDKLTLVLPKFPDERVIPVIALELNKPYNFVKWISL